MHTDASILLIDWAGTVTVPMREMMVNAATELGYDEDDLVVAFGGLAEYFLTDDSPIHAAERGEIDHDDLVAFVEQKAPGAGRLFDPSQPSLLSAADRPEMITLLEDLRDADVMVIMATNNFQVSHELLAERYLDTGLVSALVNSALVGVRKPDPEFFHLCLEAAGAPAEEVVLADDQQRNLDAAAALGIGTIFVDIDATPAVAQIRSILL